MTEHGATTARLSPVDLETTDLEWLGRCLGRGELAPLHPDDVAMFAAELEASDYAGGTCIFREHEVLTRVSLVRSGAVELSRTVGGRRLGVQVLGSGDVFGDVPVLMHVGAPFDACAIEDSVVWSIEAVRLLALLGRRPGLSQRWMVSFAGRMGGLQARIGQLLAGSLEARIASFLTDAGNRHDVEISQQTLAELLGSSRSSVNQALGRLQARGLVALSYRHIAISDSRGLDAVASGLTGHRSRHETPSR